MSNIFTEVMNLATGERAGFSLPPHEAVVSAYEGLTRKNWNTADYDMSQASVGELTVSCGDWAALLPLGEEIKAYLITRAQAEGQV